MAEDRWKGKTYLELLRHPNWQRKRLEVLSRANFRCVECGSTEKTLEVHHAYYEKGMLPWEYPDVSLHCLCRDCHAQAQDAMKLLHRSIGKIDDIRQVETIYGFALSYEAAATPNRPLDVFSAFVAQGLAMGLEMSFDLVVDAVDKGEGVVDGATLKALRQKQFAPDDWAIQGEKLPKPKRSKKGKTH